MTILPPLSRTYGAYGHLARVPGTARTGYAGEVIESGLDSYLLGERFYVPYLRCFISPDPASPFAAGGFSRYAYCSGDPVNRVDPSGNASLAWLGRLLGQLWGGVTTATNAMAHATPAAALARVSQTAQAVSVGVGIGALVAAELDDNHAATIMGWMSIGAGIASAALAGLSKSALARNQGPNTLGSTRQTRGVGNGLFIPTGFHLGMDYKRTTYTSLDGHHQVKVYRGRKAVERKIPGRAIRNAKGKIIDITPEWTAYPNSNGNGGMNYVTDIKIWDTDRLTTVKNSIPADNLRIEFLSGVHGAPDGDNWTWRGARMHKEPSFYYDDLREEKTMRKDAGNHGLHIRDIGGMKAKDFKHLLQSDAHIVHSYCCSAADWKLMRHLNIHEAKIYLL